MHYAVMDLEADGLLYDATKIHCICWKVHLNGKVYDHTYTDNFTEAVELLNQCELVIGHNICGYDAPLLEKLGYGILDNLRDTLIMGQLVEPDRAGGHSLASYDPDTKVENEDWSVLTENMLKRCVADVDITYRLYKRLEKKMANWNWKPAIELEQEVLKYHARQGLNGVLFDKGKARHLYQIIDKEIKAIDKKLVKEVGYKVKPFDKLTPIPNVDSFITEYEGKVIKPFKIDGTMNSKVAKYYGQQSVWGTTCRVEFYQINLNSPIQIKDYLTSIGWIPDEWNYKIDKLTKRIVYEDGEPVKTTAKISESSMSSVEDELGRMIMRRQIIKHRRSMIYSTKGEKVTGLIGNIRSDGRIEAGGHSCGTNTRRYRHRGVVNIPKASDSVVYGKELRDLFIAPTGYCLMGTDADSLEARIAGHFCAEYDGGVFAEKLLEHDVHQELADFLSISRSEAKTVYYGMCIAEGSEVLTDKGLVEISSVTRLHKVWDGIEFVSHDGVIYKGEKDVITYRGLTATPDHKVWTNEKGKVELQQAAMECLELTRTGEETSPIKYRDALNNRRVCKERRFLQICRHSLLRLPQNKTSICRQSLSKENNNLHLYTKKVQKDSAKTRETIRNRLRQHSSKVCQRSLQNVLQVQREGDRVTVRVKRRVHQMVCKKSRRCREFGYRQNRQQRSLRKRKSSSCFSQREHAEQRACYTEKKKVYDILNAGDLHRFTVSNVLVSNCYGAQPRKVANTLKVSLKRGKEVFEGFWEKNDALAKVRDASIKQWKNEGYLVALDGGKLFPRSPHSVMNTLFQCAGSLTVKMATIYTNRKIDEEGLNELVKQVIHYHDEYTLELLDNKKLKEQLTPLVESSWEEAGQHFNLNVGITGSAQYGYSWKEIH